MPEPVIPPGFALTGMPAYLVTGDQHALYHEDELSVHVGPFTFTVQVVAEGTTTVDWGDGSEPVTYSVPGRAYPDGEVMHIYTDKGEVSVVVTDSWEITFNVVSPVQITDVVTAELASDVIEAFEVNEYRAVRVDS
jgi:hypothetical protein